MIMAQIMVGESKREPGSENSAEEFYEAWKLWNQSLLAKKKNSSANNDNKGNKVKISVKSESDRTYGSKLLDLKGPALGIRGFVTGFLINRKAMAMLGDVHLCWKYDTSIGEQQVQWVDPLLYYNGVEVT